MSVLIPVLVGMALGIVTGAWLALKVWPGERRG